MSSRCSGCVFANECGNSDSKLSIVVIYITPPQPILKRLLARLLSKQSSSPFDLVVLVNSFESDKHESSTPKDDVLGVLNSQICEHRETHSKEKSSRQLVNAAYSTFILIPHFLRLHTLCMALFFIPNTVVQDTNHNTSKSRSELVHA
jgi:hypothetical protein